MLVCYSHLSECEFACGASFLPCLTRGVALLGIRETEYHEHNDRVILEQVFDHQLTPQERKNLHANSA